MKNVVFLARLYHPHAGGVETHVEQLSRVLIARGYDITVLCEQHDPSIPLQSIHEGVKILRVPHALLQSKVGLWKWIWAHRQLFQHAERIHIHDVFWWILPLALQMQKKSCITFHGYEGVDAPHWGQIFWHRLGAQLTRRNLCIGGFHQKWYGVRPDAVSFGAVTPVAASSDHATRKRIAYVGRLADDAGIMNYLQGFRRLVERQPGWTLDVYGDGPQMQEAQQYATRYHLSVRFLGWKKDVTSVLGKYCVVYVSRYLGILEALSQGRRIVAAYNNAIKFDYLIRSPFADWIQIVQTPQDVARATLCIAPPPPESVEWARAQTWEAMADVYESLWNA